MITVRKSTYNDSTILDILKKKATEWEEVLIKNCITPTNIFVWIKEFNKQYYYKIEIDACGQEIQYEMNIIAEKSKLLELEIDETHFKSFRKENGNWKREDLSKEQVAFTIRAIDDIIKTYELSNDFDV